MWYSSWIIKTVRSCYTRWNAVVRVIKKIKNPIIFNWWNLYKYFTCRCVASWLNYHSAEKLLECNDSDTIEGYMSSLTKHVMSYIRYPMILPRQMAQLLMVPVVKNNKDFFVDKMAAAMEYNLIKKGMVFKIVNHKCY